MQWQSRGLGGEKVQRGDHIEAFGAAVIVVGAKVKPQRVVAVGWCTLKHGVHNDGEPVAAVQRMRVADHHRPCGRCRGEQKVSGENLAIRGVQVQMFHTVTVP